MTLAEPPEDFVEPVDPHFGTPFELPPSGWLCSECVTPKELVDLKDTDSDPSTLRLENRLLRARIEVLEAQITDLCRQTTCILHTFNLQTKQAAERSSSTGTLTSLR